MKFTVSTAEESNIRVQSSDKFQVETFSSDEDEVLAQMLAEFTALRAEILKREEMRQSMLTFVVLAAGAIFALGTAQQGFDSPWPLLIFPLLALFLAFGWMQNDVRIGELGWYIREKLERPTTEGTERDPRLKGLGWESWLRNLYKNAAFRLVELTALLVFFLTQALAVVLALAILCTTAHTSSYAKSISPSLLDFMLVLDLLAIAATWAVLRFRSIKLQNHPPGVREDIWSSQINEIRDRHWALLLIPETWIPLMLVGAAIFTVSVFWPLPGLECSSGFAVNALVGVLVGGAIMLVGLGIHLGKKWIYHIATRNFTP